MIREYIRQIIDSAISKTKILKDLPGLDFAIERPRQKKYGDWSANAAMTAAPLLKKSPMDIAKALEKNINDPKGYLSKVETAPPGFINMTFKNTWYQQVVKRIEELDDRFGEIDLGKKEKVLLEYVSANPVGPLHLGHGRWAAVGDTLARVLKKAGFTVTTEFYVNNYGRQMKLFYDSVIASYRNNNGEDVEPPEDGYKGAYIDEIAKSLLGQYKNQSYNNNLKNPIKQQSYKMIMELIKTSLKKMYVDFDNYFKEKEDLHDSDVINSTVKYLQKGTTKPKKTRVYKKDGALWLNTSDFSDEKDRVLIKSDNERTYFVADIAYHRNKLERGYDKLVNIWGADHHGYIARVKASIAALGKDPEKLQIVLGQLVNLKQSGKPVKMSKRTGELITLDELIDEVGTDAVRYTFLTKSTDTALDFDIDLVKEQSDKNPVYYVQYAHARISSILRFAEEKGVQYKRGQADLNLITEKSEIDLIRVLEEFEEVIEKISLKYTPHLLTAFAHKLATAFHSFYTQSRVILPDNEKLTQARLALLTATQITLRNVLKLLGVSAPEKM